jgi:lysozyme
MSVASDLVAARLPREEGERGMPYKDSKGLDTIGIGTLLPLTHEECVMLAAGRLAKKEAELVPYSWYTALNDARKSVFLDLAFNMGTDKLLHFVQTLAAVQRGDWQTAHDQLLNSQWHKDVGDGRALPLAKILLTGEL